MDYLQQSVPSTPPTHLRQQDPLAVLLFLTAIGMELHALATQATLTLLDSVSIKLLVPFSYNHNHSHSHNLQPLNLSMALQPQLLPLKVTATEFPIVTGMELAVLASLVSPL